MAMLQSCSTYKLIDTSNPEEPEWISKPQKVFFVYFSEIELVQGLGIHTISLMTDEINLKSNNDYLISGTIYYINSFNSIKHNENFRAVETIYFN